LYCFVETLAPKIAPYIEWQAGAALASPSGSKEVAMVLGIQDSGVWLAYVLSLASAALCVGYGIVNWNKGEEPAKKEDVDWAKEEKTEVEDTL
jgi:hypothetical protein